MKKVLLSGITALAFGMLGAGSSHAAVISYDLNEIIAGGSTLTPTPSFGTVTYSDNATDANKVDVSISLNGTGQKALSFYFNYNDASFSNSTPLVFTGGLSTFSISENNQQADGYTAGKFDIQTPATGNGGTEPLNFTIGLAGENLNPSDFNFTDSSAHLFNSVHIGNCGSNVCTPAGLNGEASIWVGSGPATSVPEPASILLLGSALLPLAIMRRRKGH